MAFWSEAAGSATLRGENVATPCSCSCPRQGRALTCLAISCERDLRPLHLTVTALIQPTPICTWLKVTLSIFDPCTQIKNCRQSPGPLCFLVESLRKPSSRPPLIVWHSYCRWRGQKATRGSLALRSGPTEVASLQWVPEVGLYFLLSSLLYPFWFQSWGHDYCLSFSVS